MKKQNKIIVVVDPTLKNRRETIGRLLVDMGFARIKTDAAKLIRSSPHDFDLQSAYFVVADNYNLRSSPLTTQRLLEMACRGMAVVVGSRSLPREFEFCCQVIYPGEI